MKEQEAKEQDEVSDSMDVDDDDDDEGEEEGTKNELVGAEEKGGVV